jgi:hypothetical protein
MSFCRITLLFLLMVASCAPGFVVIAGPGRDIAAPVPERIARCVNSGECPLWTRRGRGEHLFSRS